MSITTLSNLLTLVASLFALLFGQMALSADIVLRQKVTPVKSVVSLGDIADIQDTSVAERQRLALTPLWIAPPVGDQRFVTRQQVFDILVNRGYQPSSLRMYGASKVAIGWENPTDVEQPAVKEAIAPQPKRPATNSIGFRVPATDELLTPAKVSRRNPVFLSDLQREQLSEQVREAALNSLEEQSGQTDIFDVEFTLSRRYEDLLSLQTSEVTVRGAKAPWTGRQTLTVEFESEKGPVELTLSATVYDTTPVLVAKRAIARGQMLTAADVAITNPPRDARVPAGRVRIYSLDEVLGKEAGRAIRAGEVVTAEACLAPQMIERGAIVSIVSAGGGIVVRRQAKAISDARYGEVTEVELLDSRERLVARVVGQGELATLGSSLRPRTASGLRQTPTYR